MSNGLFDDIDLTTVISDETIRQRFVVSSEQITSEEAEDTDPPVDADPVVNTTQDEGFNSIQEAIDEADDGDTIQLNDEEFEEDLTINVENITIEGLADVTVIGIVTIEVSGVRIEGCEFAPDNNVEQIVSVTANADNVEIEDCSFSGTADIALVFEGDKGEVIDCVFDEVDVTEHVLVIYGVDVEVSGCTFLVINEIEVVRVEADEVEIEDCNFEAIDVVVKRFINVIETVTDIIVVECGFEGEVELEVIFLRSDDSKILGCNFEDAVKTELSASIIVVTGNNADVEQCAFLVSDPLESVVFVDGADSVNIDDCDFEVTEEAAVNRFILVSSASTNVVVIRCVFIGVVNVTTIEHDGTGDSEIRDCDFGAVKLDDGATLIIRVDDVTVEEVDVQIVEIEIGDELQVFSSIVDAIDAAEEDASIFVQPGTYESIFVETSGLDIQGPLAGTSGDSDARVPDDPETEAVIEDSVTVEAEGVTVDGFSIQDTVAVDGPDAADAPDEDEIAIQNNVIEVDNNDAGVSVDNFADSLRTRIESNRIVNGDFGVSGGDTNELTSPVSDVLEVTDNTIEDADTGIELRPGDDIADDELIAVRDDNEFIDTDPKIDPEPLDADRIVDGEGDEDKFFETVFDAVENAGPGTDIAVRPGTYVEDEFIPVDKQGISIQSTDGREETTLETNFSIGIYADDVAIDGFEIVPQEAEAGLFVSDDVVDATIRNNDIDVTKNEYDIFGIGMRGTSATITGNSIETGGNMNDVQIRGPDSDGDIPERINDVELDDQDGEQDAFDAYKQTLLNQNDIDDVGER